MQTADKPEFVMLMAQLGEMFSKKITPPLTELYWLALESQSIEKMRFAVQWCLNNSEHFPRPVNLREAMQNMPRPVERFIGPSEQPPWLYAVNQLYFCWMWEWIKKRKSPVRKMAERRVICWKLAADFEAMEASGDKSATREWMKQCFDQQMDLISCEDVV